MEWDTLFSRETTLFQKVDPTDEEMKEIDTTNARLLQILKEMEQVETGIHRMYLSSQEPKEK